VADTERKEWTINSIRSAVQAVEDKKMGLLKDLLLLSIALVKHSFEM
jgi:hypothetical protein